MFVQLGKVPMHREITLASSSSSSLKVSTQRPLLKQCSEYHGHIALSLRGAKYRRRHSQKQHPQGWYILHHVHVRVTIICCVVTETSPTWQDYDPHCWAYFCCGGWRIQTRSARVSYTPSLLHWVRLSNKFSKIMSKLSAATLRHKL